MGGLGNGESDGVGCSVAGFHGFSALLWLPSLSVILSLWAFVPGCGQFSSLGRVVGEIGLGLAEELDILPAFVVPVRQGNALDIALFETAGVGAQFVGWSSFEE